MARVAVVGGGITGLACAWFLAQRDHDPVVYEASPRVGGKLATVDFHDVRVEAGADSFLPRDQLPLELCRAIGLGDELVSPEVFGAYIWSDDALRKLPAGFSYGLPVRPWDARRVGLLSVAGALRAHADLLWPRPLSGPDVSVGAFVRTRFGSEVAAKLVDPLLAGTRGGRGDDISLAAGAAEIDALARRERSVLQALRRGTAEIGAGSTAFVSVAGGIERLATTLAGRLPDVRTSSPVDSLNDLDADAVVVTTPAPQAAGLVESRAPGAAAALRTITYVASLSIALAYPPGAVRVPPDGSGVLVPSIEGLGIAAATWYSQKWPHARPPDEATIVRCFVGGRGEMLPPDAGAIARAAAALKVVMGTTAQPIDALVTRWDEGLPHYRVGHLDKVAAIEAALPDDVVVAGASYRGSGIPDCIAQARRAADMVAGRLGDASK